MSIQATRAKLPDRLKTDYCESMLAEGVFIVRHEIRDDGRIEEIKMGAPMAPD